VAHAETPSIVVIGSVLRGQSAARAPGTLSSQIEADLTRLGFRVLLRDADETVDTPRELQAAAREAGAEAAVSVQPSALGVDVWLVDRVTGKTLSREVVQTGPGAEQDRVIAVRVVELLRASLLELQLPSGADGELPATSQLQALVGLPSTGEARERGQQPALPAAEGSGVFRFAAAGGISSSVGALPITPLAALGAFWQPSERLAIGLSSFIPLASAETSAQEGSASIATWELHAGPRLYPLTRAGAIRPFADLGLALIWCQINATRAASPLIAASDQLLSAGGHAGVGLDWQLSSSFSLFATGGATVAAAKPVVQFAGRDVLTLARPIVSGTLGVEYRATSEARRDW
jgi:hypothetical protein